VTAMSAHGGRADVLGELPGRPLMTQTGHIRGTMRSRAMKTTAQPPSVITPRGEQSGQLPTTAVAMCEPAN